MESKGPEVEGNRESLMANFVPHVGMEFRTSDEAWAFWLSYGGQKGFEVRKRYTNKRPSDGKITSCKFVCGNEGHRLPDKRDHLTKCPRAETRTDCQVHMNLKIVRKKETLIVSDLVLEHNHALHLPTTLHLMASQRKISDLQGFEIETADDAGIGPKAAHELVSRQVGGPLNLSYTLRDHKNYLRTKRQREIAYGQAGSMLKYFHDKIAENPSFQYALQMDCEEQITNIFWADAKMIMDYAHFGDVVSFDTTFGTNKESRPFGVFVGFNHFRETVVFGAALMYDETFESFKWLFEAFLKSHNGQQPKTFYTDQDAAMGKAVSQVFIEAWHGLCTFHIMQNAVKHLHEESKLYTPIIFEAFKVLDLMNIKSLPSQYVLKRWTREARTITVQDNQGRNIIENPKMDAMLRFKYMSHKFLNLAHEAANSPECTMLVDSTLDILRKQMAEKINTSTSTFHDSCTASANASPPNDLLINASHLARWI